MTDGLLTEEEAHTAIAEDILGAVERNATGEWVMPWAGFSARPTNAFSGRPFKGQNTLALWAAARRNGYTAHLWASPEAWERNGGVIRTGETGTLILVPIFDEEAPAAAWTRETPGIARKLGPIGGDALGGQLRPMIGFERQRWFNVHQVDGVPIAPPAVPSPTQAALQLEDALLSWRPLPDDTVGGPALIEGGVRAFWNPATDRVNMPPKAAFQPRGGLSGYEYYVLTFAHECTHATGSASRLRRDTLLNYGKGNNRPKEELVAEIGAAFLCAQFGLPAQLLSHNTAYIASWMQHLGTRGKRKSFFWAVGQAENACAYILRRAGGGGHRPLATAGA